MDFKNYVRTLLESSEKAKDEDEVKDENEEEDESDEEEEEDESDEKKDIKESDDEEDDEESEEESDEEEEDSEDEEEASVKTKKKDPGTGKEPSVKTKCCSVCGKDPCCCGKKKSLKEEMIFSSRYSCGTANSNVLSEETRVLVEGIKNNSASKYLAKLAKKAEKEAAKFANKGMKEEATISKKAASNLKEVSNKLFRCETRYQGGDPSAKKEYKQLCRQYSKELKGISKGAKGIGLIFTILAGFVLLGAVGTSIANDDVIEKLNYGFQNKDKMPEVLKSLANNNKKFIEDSIARAAEKTGDLLNKAKEGIKPHADKIADSFNSAKDKAGEALGGMKKTIRANLAGWE